MNKKLKVLLLYPNVPLLNPPPVSIGTLAALLKREGVEVKVFDTTFYRTQESISDKAKEENLQVRPFSFDESKLPVRNTSLKDDLRILVKDYNPDLVGMSVLEGTWKIGVRLLDSIADIDAPVVVGGVFATFAPEIVFEHPAVTAVCVGEGEGTIVEFCQRLKEGGGYSDIDNLWVRDGEGAIIENPIRKVVDINRLPVPDYSVFDVARLLRPMAGYVYRTIPIETIRGCPYKCTFCNSPTTAGLYRNAKAGTFFRKKSMDRIKEELGSLIQLWDAEYVYFLSDSFLAISDAEFDRFVDIYGEFKLPFWIQSRVEHITPNRAKKLKEVGCHRMSMGLEHGNYAFRHKVLGKKFKNSEMIEASMILADVGIPLTVNNIIGFPDETRKLIFDTIELNRQIAFDTTNAHVFTPFHGTPLHEYCVKRGYINMSDTVGCVTVDTPLDMPQLSKEEIAGLRKTFALYARMPKKYWPEIKRAEKNDDKGTAVFKKLREEYIKKFF